MLAALETESDAGFPAGTRTKLRGADDYLRAARVVVATRLDVPVGDIDDRLPVKIRDEERLLELIERYGVSSPVQRLLVALKIEPGKYS
jgi:hypothetical protein